MASLATCEKTRQLLQQRDDANQSRATLSQPETVTLTEFTDNYRRSEALGLEAASNAAFVLVAGGLGERLGYDDIKMAIPVELTTLTTYLGLYCRTILAIQQRSQREKSGDVRPIPFLIMTSAGISDRLNQHLKEHDFFGLSPEQVTVFEQTLVPAVADADARLATLGPYNLLLKPSGHGDVHAMLHRLGLAQRLAAEGREHLIFIQDTNALIVNLLLPALGESIRQEFDFTFVGVPRVPGEPIGAVVRLSGPDGEKTVNVEYNQLEEFLQAQGEGGDLAADGGFSAYPGNINLLVTRVKPYLAALKRTEGVVPEFINPKYADETKTKFAKPTRLETLMQDIAALYPSGSRIGVALFDREWSLAAMKNSLSTAAALADDGQPDYSAGAAESGFYQCQRVRLRLAGARVEPSQEVPCHGVPLRDGARVVLSPRFSILLDDAVGRFDNVFVSRHATLVLDGADITLRDVRLEGEAALEIYACDGAVVEVEGLSVDRPGYTMRHLDQAEVASDETPGYLRIRGL